MELPSYAQMSSTIILDIQTKHLGIKIKCLYNSPLNSLKPEGFL